MKLVELLAAHLTKWPQEFRDRHETGAMTQDKSKSLNTLDGGKEADVSQFYNGVWAGSHWTHANGRTPSELAEDYKTAIVTKAMWEVEKSKPKEPQWKRHRGGKQPVADGVLVEVKFRDHVSELRDGTDTVRRACDWTWHHDKMSDDIMQYRVIEESPVDSTEQPEELKQENEMATVSELKVDVDVVVGFNPMFARDRIRAINSQFEVLTAERAALIQTLADEGFTLISETAVDPMLMPVVEIKVPREFQVGDIVKLVDDGNSFTAMNIGEVGTITELCGSDQTALVMKDGDDYQYWPSVKDLELVKAAEDK